MIVTMKQHRHRVLRSWRHLQGDPDVDFTATLDQLVRARTHKALDAIDASLRTAESRLMGA